jgi:hypothetical protein
MRWSPTSGQSNAPGLVPDRQRPAAQRASGQTQSSALLALAAGPGSAAASAAPRAAPALQFAPRPRLCVQRNRPVRKQTRGRNAARAAGLRPHCRRAVTGATVLVARAQSPTRVGESVGLAGANRSVRPGAAASNGWTASAAAAAVSAADAVGRATVRRRSPLWRTRAAAAPRRRPRLCRDLLRLHPPRRPASVGAVPVRRYRGYSVSTVSTAGTAGVRARQPGGARARRPLLRARVCAGVRVPGVGLAAHYSRRMQHYSAVRGRPRCAPRALDGGRVCARNAAEKSAQLLKFKYKDSGRVRVRGRAVPACSCHSCLRAASPAAATQAGVGRRSARGCPKVVRGVRGYSVSTVSTPAPLACVRCSSAERVRGVHCFVRVCAGARVPGGGCQRCHVAQTTRTPPPVPCTWAARGCT